MYTDNFCFGYIAVYCFFETFPGGWVGVGVGVTGWVVGISDFNENPVISLDLDFDLGFVKIDYIYEYLFPTSMSIEFSFNQNHIQPIPSAL